MNIDIPEHPGIILKKIFMEPSKISVTKLAKCTGVSRVNISKIINGKSIISPEMAIRLSETFKNSPEFWMFISSLYEIHIAKQKMDLSKIIKL